MQIKSKILLALAIFSVLLFLGLWLQQAGGRYSHNQVQLSLSFTAKDYCSCIFVTKSSVEQCLLYASLAQLSPQLEVNWETQSTRSTYLGYFYKEAKYLGDSLGCQLVNSVKN